MKGRRLLITALVRLYPTRWRSQYGMELRHLLGAQALRPGSVVDVIRGALWQHLRTAAPSTLLGTGAMLLVLAGVVLTPTAYGHGGTALIQPSHKTFPTITVTFLASELFALLLLVCGCWTQLRYGQGAMRAAMWMTLLAGMPVFAMGFLLLTGAIDMTIPMAAGLIPTPAPSPWAMMIAPAMRAPESAIWGALGGQLGRWLGRRMRPAASA